MDNLITLKTQAYVELQRDPNNSDHKYIVLSHNAIFVSDLPHQENTFRISLCDTRAEMDPQYPSCLDIYHGYRGFIKIYFKSVPECRKWLEYIIPLTNVSLEHLYQQLNEMGQGGFGTCYRAIHRATGDQVALKRIADLENNCGEELNLMLMMDHENIINILDVFRFHHETVICLPLMDGDLWDLAKLYPRKRLDEDVARHCMYQVLEGLAYMHDLGIAHRDIKDPNILYSFNGGILTVKIADFGAASRLRHGQDEFYSSSAQHYTTHQYASLEQVREQTYGLKSDIFSLGVTLFKLLTGTLPFYGQGLHEVYNSIDCGRRTDTGGIWHNLSSEARDLVDSMLIDNEHGRISARDALRHPWFGYNETVEDSTSTSSR